MDFIQTLVFGIVTGSFLIVATLGFALVSRVDKFLNIAHAEYISLGAFLTYYLNARQGWPIIPAGAVAIVAVAILAVIVAKLVYAPMRGAGAIVLIITSVGVAYMIHGGIEAIVKPGIYSFDIGNEKQYDLGLFTIGSHSLIIIGLAAATVLAVHLILTRTAMGLHLRALASDPSLAAGRGVNIRKTSAGMWLIAGALAGLAGVLLGLQGAINTDLSFEQILLIMSVSILAGFGSIYGVVAAALLLGVAMDLSTLVIPAGYREVIAFAAVILALTVRPEGLSGSKLARREA
jgi:neutral amino acid transport system permease protein